jgi:hypothetical protein
MRVLLDECVDWRLLRDLAEHDAKTVKQLGWSHVRNGALLRLAETAFDAFVTVDTNLPYQQDIASFRIGVVVLRGRTTRLPDLRELLGPLRDALSSIRPGELQIVSWRDVTPAGG